MDDRAQTVSAGRAVGATPSPAVSRIRAWRRRAVPFVLACVGVWLLVGCIYVPLPEHRINTTDKEQKDFRDLVGDPGSKRPLRPGAVTRLQVVATLGQPPFSSADGRAVGYTLTTQRAVWLFPFCFTATSAKERLYGLRLVFDEHDRLSGWKLIHLDQSLGWFNASGVYPRQAINALNNEHDGPELEGPPEPSPAATVPATQP